MSLINTNHLDKSIDQPDIVAAADPQFVKTTAEYNVSNPHPKYGKDDNIINQQGHTIYPKMVYPNGPDHAYVIVKNAEEEAEAMGGKPAELKQDGPTVQQFVAAGYKASNYPPEGYASKSSDEEIKEEIAKEKPATSGWGS